MTQNVLRRVVGSAIAIGLAATLTAVCGTGSARAATWGATWTYFDNMEPRSTSQPQDRFFLESDNRYAANDFFKSNIYNPFSHSGLYSARLDRVGSSGTFSAVGQTVSIVPRQAGYWTTCRFSAWVQGATGARFNIEVIDPQDWSYVSVTQFTQPTAWSWRQASTGQFVPPPRNVVLRVSYLDSAAAAAFVDDFRVTCTY